MLSATCPKPATKVMGDVSHKHAGGTDAVFWCLPRLLYSFTRSAHPVISRAKKSWTFVGSGRNNAGAFVLLLMLRKSASVRKLMVIAGGPVWFQHLVCHKSSTSACPRWQHRFRIALRCRQHKHCKSSLAKHPFPHSPPAHPTGLTHSRRGHSSAPAAAASQSQMILALHSARA